MTSSDRRTEAIFREHSGVLRTSTAISLGIHPRSLYRLRDQGLIEQISRGVYRWSGLPPLSQPDLVAVSTRVPIGVICTISALAFHEITTQIPHKVHIALPRGSAKPRIHHPPVQIYRFSKRSFLAGIVSHSIDGSSMRIYSAGKTVADCFKFRNSIGIDVAIEGLRLCLERRLATPAEIEEFAGICRVERVMGPYLEAML
jgi:predicted transcriptional regulator of viral defense system